MNLAHRASCLLRLNDSTLVTAAQDRDDAGFVLRVWDATTGDVRLQLEDEG